MCLRHTTTCIFSLLITTFIYRMVNVLASHYHLQPFIIEYDIYLQNSECTCVMLLPAVFHYRAWHLFTEWWIFLRHTTTYSFSFLITTFIYRIVDVLASHYRLQFFIIEYDIYLQNNECACVTLPPPVFHYWARLLFTKWWMSFHHTTTCSCSLLSPVFIYIIVICLSNNTTCTFSLLSTTFIYSMEI